LQQISTELTHRGASPVGATAQAHGLIASMVGQQASLLGFLDCFLLLIPVALTGVLMGFLIKKIKIPTTGTSEPAH
jgi:hypothetical protein